MGIVRWWIMCSVPVDSDGLTQEDIRRGIKKYLLEFAPKLAETPIRWPPKRKQLATDAEIFREARRAAKPQTQKERIDIFLSDIGR